MNRIVDNVDDSAAGTVGTGGLWSALTAIGGGLVGLATDAGEKPSGLSPGMP